MNLKNIMLSQRSQKIIWNIQYRQIQRDRKWTGGCQGLGGGGTVSHYLMGIRFSCDEIWNVSEFDTGGGCTNTVNVLNAIEMYSLKQLLLWSINFTWIKKTADRNTFPQSSSLCGICVCVPCDMCSTRTSLSPLSSRSLGSQTSWCEWKQMRG